MTDPENIIDALRCDEQAVTYHGEVVRCWLELQHDDEHLSLDTGQPVTWSTMRKTTAEG